MEKKNKPGHRLLAKLARVFEPARSLQLATAPVEAVQIESSIAHAKKIHSIRLGVIAGLILTILGGAVYWFNDNNGNLSRTYLAGFEVTHQKSAEELENELSQKATAYTLTIEKPYGSTSNYKLEQLGVAVDTAGSVTDAQTARKQSNFLSRLQWWRNYESPLKLKVDETKLQDFIKNQATVIIEPAVNATLVIENGAVSTTPEAKGKGFIIPGAREKIISSVANLQNAHLKLEEQSLKPKITNYHASHLKTKVEEIMSKKVTLKLSGREFTASPAEIGEWFDLPDFNQAESISYEINSGKVLYYLDKISKPYVHATKSQIVMTSASGKQVVLVRGVNGTDVVDKENIAAEIAKALNAQKDFTSELTVSHAPFKTVQAENYDKWIVVDLTNKQLYAYEKSNLVRQIAISAGAPATPTVLGHYKILSKVRIQDMRGLNVDGTRYFQPDVEWVSYFAPGGYAIHGNYWRPLSWFGNINSSHGCVGMPNDKAQWVYNWAPIGTPIITHL